jgi:purine-cytosine permease-like protein
MSKNGTSEPDPNRQSRRIVGAVAIVLLVAFFVLLLIQFISFIVWIIAIVVVWLISNFVLRRLKQPQKW